MTIEQYVNALMDIEIRMMKLHQEKVDLMDKYLSWLSKKGLNESIDKFATSTATFGNVGPVK